MFINITPLLNPHVGLVNVTVAVGFGLITTLMVPIDTHPIALVPVTVYTLVAGVAVETAEPVGDAKPAPDQVYVDAPLAVKLSVGPTQKGAFEFTVSGVGAGAVILNVLVIDVPQIAFEIVTV